MRYKSCTLAEAMCAHRCSAKRNNLWRDKQRFAPKRGDLFLYFSEKFHAKSTKIEKTWRWSVFFVRIFRMQFERRKNICIGDDEIIVHRGKTLRIRFFIHLASLLCRICTYAYISGHNSRQEARDLRRAKCCENHTQT